MRPRPITLSRTEREGLRELSPGKIYDYANYVLRGRSLEVEQLLTERDTDGEWMFKYAAHLANERVPLFEKRLREMGPGNAWAIRYAALVARTALPWVEAPGAKPSSAALAMYFYAIDVVKRRVPAFEPYLGKWTPYYWLHVPL